MTAHLDSLQRTVAILGSLLFTVALVAFSTPMVPIA